MKNTSKTKKEEKNKNTLIIEYIDDYNILELDKKIKEIIKEEQKNKEKLQSELERRIKLDPNNLTYIEKHFNDKEIEKLKSEIKEIEEEKKYKKYLEETKEIIENYIKLKNKPINLKIGEEVPINNERLEIIERYFDIAKKYIDIILKPEYKFKKGNYCNYCGSEIEKNKLEEDNFCSNCSREILIIEDKIVNKREDFVENNESETIDNFLKAFIKFQGLQEDNINPELYNELDEYFKKLGKPTGEEIRKMSLDEKGKRGNTNRNILYKALSDLGRSEYYEDINLIAKNYWGWKLPYLMHLQERIIDKYIKTQKVFYSLPREIRERNSSLGTQYRLWRHLQLEGYNFPKEDFKIAENSDSLNLHERLWKIMCKLANDPDIYYIP